MLHDLLGERGWHRPRRPRDRGRCVHGHGLSPVGSRRHADESRVERRRRHLRARRPVRAHRREPDLRLQHLQRGRPAGVHGVHAVDGHRHLPCGPGDDVPDAAAAAARERATRRRPASGATTAPTCTAVWSPCCSTSAAASCLRRRRPPRRAPPRPRPGRRLLAAVRVPPERRAPRRVEVFNRCQQRHVLSPPTTHRRRSNLAPPNLCSRTVPPPENRCSAEDRWRKRRGATIRCQFTTASSPSGSCVRDGVRGGRRGRGRW